MNEQPAAAHVLVADNDPGVNELLREVLSQRGLAALSASDGLSALAMLQQSPVPLLVCDLDMPKMGGLELVERLPTLPNPPAVLVVSGYLDTELQQRLMRSPCVRGIFSKPFDLFEFAAVASRIVAERAGPLP